MKTINTLFVIPIYNVRFSDYLPPDFKLPFDLKLTNDKKFISDLVSDEDFRTAIGEMTYNGILNGADSIIYSSIQKSADFDVRDHIHQEIVKVKTFFLKLWMVKEHSVLLKEGIAEYPFYSRNSSLIKHGVSVGFSSSFFTNTSYVLSNGTRELVSYDMKELNQAINYCKDVIVGRHDKNIYQEGVENIVTRLTRANFFIGISFGMMDLGIRISQYCTALECLFASSNTELKHRLSERAAFFIGENPEERRSIYNSISNAYSIRSSVVHGDTINQKKLKSLGEISKNCDDILRRILIKINSDEMYLDLFNTVDTRQTGVKKFEDFFSKLLFGINSVASNDNNV